MIHTLPDVTGTGVAVALSSIPYQARWVKINALSTNGADVRLGDSATSASQGLAIPKGTGELLPGISDTFGASYALTGVYVYIANGDKISIAYGD